jgi:hypothetical protein
MVSEVTYTDAISQNRDHESLLPDYHAAIVAVSTSQNGGGPVNSLHAAKPRLAPRHDRGIASARGVQGPAAYLPSQVTRCDRQLSTYLGSARNQRQSKGAVPNCGRGRPPYLNGLRVHREHAFSVACGTAAVRPTAARPRRFSLPRAATMMPAPFRTLKLTFSCGLSVALALALVPVSLPAQTTLGTQTLSLTLQAAGLLYNVPGSLSLTHTGTVFNAYTGTVTLQYRARTSSGGSGAITVRATTDFPCASGGPCITSPPTAGDALTYTCSGATLGTNCSGAQTVSTAASTNVVTIPASVCTGAGSPCNNASPNTVSVSFTLTDDPKYKTGSYSATLTWTISAT